MVYLAEEMEPDALGFSMGLYIGGTAAGGMAGRGSASGLRNAWRATRGWSTGG